MQMPCGPPLQIFNVEFLIRIEESKAELAMGTGESCSLANENA
jgi:hypothetical protein